MPRRPDETLPAVVEQTWSLWVWFDGHLGNLPAHARASAGARLVDALLALLEDLSAAAYLPRHGDARAVTLQRANQRVAFARLLLRGLLARKYLSVPQHAHAAEQLDAIGRGVGGWLRAQRSAT